jgi:hypothetical protein
LMRDVAAVLMTSIVDTLGSQLASKIARAAGCAYPLFLVLDDFAFQITFMHIASGSLAWGLGLFRGEAPFAMVSVARRPPFYFGVAGLVLVNLHWSQSLTHPFSNLRYSTPRLRQTWASRRSSYVKSSRRTGVETRSMSDNLLVL